MLKIFSMVVGEYGENCYAVHDKQSLRSFIVDPGSEHERILDGLKKHNIKPEFILITHGHLDHVNAVDAMVNEFGIPVYIAEKDMTAVREGRTIFGTIVSDVQYINDGDIIKFGDKDIKVISTPGHSMGGVCFAIDDIIFSGDTLFYTAVGRTDMYGGNYEEILRSVKNKLFTLPDNTVVLPGHGQSTSIGFEKANNPFFI